MLAEKDFVVNSVFGPYEGVVIHSDDLQKLSMAGVTNWRPATVFSAAR